MASVEVFNMGEHIVIVEWYLLIQEVYNLASCLNRRPSAANDTLDAANAPRAVR
jgi:hypothetical protein